MKKSD